MQHQQGEEAEEQVLRAGRRSSVAGCPHEATFVLQSEHSQTLSKAGAGLPVTAPGIWVLLAGSIWAPWVIVWKGQGASRVRRHVCGSSTVQVPDTGRPTQAGCLRQILGWLPSASYSVRERQTQFQGLDGVAGWLALQVAHDLLQLGQHEDVSVAPCCHWGQTLGLWWDCGDTAQHPLPLVPAVAPVKLRGLFFTQSSLGVGVGGPCPVACVTNSP